MEGPGIKMNMTPAHPGLFIQTEIIDELGLDTAQIAAILGVAEAVVCALVNQQTRLSPELALRLEKAFDLQMDLLLPVQAWYDAVQLRARWDEAPVERYQPG